MNKAPWDEMRRLFEEEGVSCREIARRFAVGYSTVTEHARKEGWRGKNTREMPTAALLEQLSETVMAALEDIREQEKPDIRSIKELLTMLRELKNLDKPAGEKNAAAQETVHVVLAPEIEAWSR